LGFSTLSGIVYFKRFRMDVDLVRPLPPPPVVPGEYRLAAWNDRLLETHAETKFQCFREELDANVFPSLASREGCRRLMAEICGRSGFVPQATWLLEHWPANARRPEPVGTIQGVADEQFGAIQNIGIVAPHRGRGLGSALLWHCLDGFRRAGIERAYLVVTARNSGAYRLYERLGFRQTQVVYKASEVAYAEW
jgi:[ribosomal protein S18]-alanine N-acetyltransferase